MKYLFLLHTDDGPPEDRASAEYARTYAEYNAAMAAMAEAGVLIECAPLRPWTSATTVRVRDGETILTDGPAAEIKEQVGGPPWSLSPLWPSVPSLSVASAS
jgi:hypothetical protein